MPANSLPQALALTAIVIGFALTAFAVALLVAAYKRLDTLDAREMTAAEDMGSPFLPPDGRPAEGRPAEGKTRRRTRCRRQEERRGEDQWLISWICSGPS